MTTGKRKRATWPRWTTSSPELSGTASTNSATSTRRPAGTPRIPPGWGPYSCSWSKIPKQSFLSRARRGKNESYIYIGYASFVHFGSTRRQTHDSPNKPSSRKTIFLRTKKDGWQCDKKWKKSPVELFAIYRYFYWKMLLNNIIYIVTLTSREERIKDDIK